MSTAPTSLTRWPFTLSRAISPKADGGRLWGDGSARVSEGWTTSGRAFTLAREYAGFPARATMRMRVAGLSLMMLASTTLLSAILAPVSGCASGRNERFVVSATPDSQPPKDGAIGEVFTEDELARTAAANVYDALSQQHSDILTGRGRGAPDVYVDGVLQQSGLDKLREITLNTITDVTYLRAEQVQSRHVSDSHSVGGTILVHLR